MHKTSSGAEIIGTQPLRVQSPVRMRQGRERMRLEFRNSRFRNEGPAGFTSSNDYTTFSHFYSWTIANSGIGFV